MDEIFGKENFRNEIVWCYSGGGIPQNEFPNKHDIILWYTRANSWVFNIQYRPYSEGTVRKQQFKKMEKNYPSGFRGIETGFKALMGV
jgi:adenine specific DNA methylase Mod